MPDFISKIGFKFISSIILDAAKFLAVQLTSDVEWEKFLIENKLTKEDGRFLRVYAKTILVLKEKKKPDFLLKFFGQEIVIRYCKEHWYEIDQGAFQQRMEDLEKWFCLDKNLTANNLDATEEISFFIQTLRSKIHLSRSPAEAEDHSILKDIQQKVTKAQSSPHPQYLSNVPAFQETFIGRVNDLQKIQMALQGDNTVVLMNGMGGIGKTTLAMHLLQEGRQEYDHIAWIEQVGDFTTSVLSTSLLLKNLNIENLSGDLQNHVLRVFHELSNINGRCLLVLDNADDGLLPYKRYLPVHWQVLITSRHELGFPNTIYLDFLTEAEALELFFEHYKREQNNELAMDIINAVDLHTLTVEILAKTAQRQRIGLEELKNLLAEKGLDFGKDSGITTAHSKEEKIDRVFGYLQKVFAISEAEFTENEIWLLKQFVALPPIFHKYELLESLLVDIGEKDKLVDGLAGLKEKGWLIFGEEEDVYKMHRVVQEVVVEELEVKYEDVKGLFPKVKSLVYFDTETRNIVQKYGYLAFGERLIKFSTGEQQLPISNLQHWLGWLYHFFGNYNRAEFLLSTSLETSLNLLESDHPEIGKYYSTYGIILSGLGKYKEAVNAFEKAIKITENVFGKYHNDVIVSQSNLAVCYRRMGQYYIAKDLQEAALENALKNYDMSHPSIAVHQSNLANIYINLGEPRKAKNLLETALKNGIDNLGFNHPEVAKRQSNLATACLEIGEYEKAKDLLQEALQNDLDNFGPNHPEVSIRQSNLAVAFQKLGQSQIAEAILKKALQTDLKLFGDNHPRVATRHNNLAQVLRSCEDYKGAIDHFQKAIEILKNNFKEGHPHIEATIKNLLDTIQQGAEAGDPDLQKRWAEMPKRQKD